MRIPLALLTVFAGHITNAAQAQTERKIPPASKAVRPFRIHVPDAQLTDLKQRLDRVRFPDEIEEANWDYGTNLKYLKQLVTYWRTNYDWRKHERALNRFNQFKTTIDGVELHFIHQRSEHPGAMPLVITHGWPGSIAEFVKIIGPLTDPVAHGGKAEDAFHVICPSMPGYGFSGKPRERGFGVHKVGAAVAKLMARLGYQRYVAQGGDWGSAVTTWLGANDAAHVAGIHVNFLTIGPPPGKNSSDGVTPKEQRRRQERGRELRDQWAYSAIQGTRPQTLGYGLNDSPVGLAAWIIDKFYAWSDCEGNIENSFTKDELLTNVMIYWTTQTITSSTRLYYESRRSGGGRRDVKVPLGVALFPKELVLPPRSWVDARYNLTHWTEMPRGGHFPALEEPQLLVNDIRAFCRTLR